MKLIEMLKPNRMDAVVWCGVLLTLIAIAAPAMLLWDTDKENSGLHFYPVAVAGMLGFTLAFASIVGSYRSYQSIDAVALIGFFVLAIVLFGWSLSLNGVWDLTENTEPTRVTYSAWLNAHGWMAIQRLALVFVVGSTAMFGVWKLIRRIYGKAASFNRSRFLITLAVIGGMFAILKNIVTENERAGALVSQFAHGATIGNLMFVLVVVSLGVFMSRNAKFWARLVVCVMTIVIVLLSGVFDVVFARVFDASFSYSLGVFWLSFLLPLLLIGMELDSEDAETEGTSRARKNVRRPSLLWGSAALLVLVSGVGFIRLFDIPTLAVCKAQRFAAARLTRSLNLSKGTKVIGRVNGQNGNQLRIIFSENSASNFFEVFESSPVTFQKLEIENMNPQIDWSWLANVAISEIELKNSMLSTKQLEADKSRVLKTGKPTAISFVDSRIASGGVISCPANPWKFVGCEPGQVGEFLSCIEKFQGQNDIEIEGGEISQSDWREIVRAAQVFDVSIRFVNLPIDFNAPLSDSQSLKKISYSNQFEDDELDWAIDQMMFLATKSAIKLNLGFGTTDKSAFFNPYLKGLDATQLDKLFSIPDPGRYVSQPSFSIWDSQVSMKTWQELLDVSFRNDVHLHRAFPAMGIRGN